MTDAVILRLPIPTLAIIGWESDAAISGSVSLTLPVFGIATGNIEGTRLTLPKPVIAITGLAGVVGTVATRLLPTLAVSGVTGMSGTVQFTLPMPQLAVSGPDRTQFTLPMPKLSLVGTTGIVGSVSQRLPMPLLSIVGAVPFTGTVGLSVRPQLAVSGVTGAVGGVGITLRAITLAASGYTGVAGSVSMTLPMFSLSASGTGPLIGTVSLNFPMLLLEATGVTAGAGVSQAFALNVTSQAISTYANYGFNSLTKFNGVYLGASSAGIFALAGATDAGTAIDAVARVGISDYGTAKLKRIDRAYIGYRADGDMVLSVITDDHQRRDYAVRALNTPGIHGNHVRIGKGVTARYWQFEIANVNGANFELNCLEVKPSRMGRRVGGESG